MDDDDADLRRTNIGGRYGSPTFMIALPFARITNADSDLRHAVVELAALIATMADAGGDPTRLAVVREAAEELATRLSSGGA